jgi:hypothetical protein
VCLVRSLNRHMIWLKWSFREQMKNIIDKMNCVDILDFTALLKDSLQHRKISNEGNCLNCRKVK